MCGRASCPILDNISHLLGLVRQLGREVYGSSPPSVFIGRTGYPHVYFGPLVPPELGDTSLMDYPEKWYGLGYRDLAEIRFKLVRGMIKGRVEDARGPTSQILSIHDILLSRRSSYAELVFEKPPRASVMLSDDVPPYGSSGLISNMRVAAAPGDRVLEKVYYDSDVNSSDAVVELYEKGVPVSVIHKLFSAGMVGRRRERRLVPTRWSITAVDDILSKSLVNRVRSMPTVNEFRVYTEERLGNKVVVVMAPGGWSYEWIEAWYPGTTWNPVGSRPEVIGDWEGFSGRTSYAEEIGGCYYAARLAVAEALVREGRQATVIALREIYRDAALPVGVWLVREIVRRTLAKRPVVFDEARSAVHHALSKLRAPRETWIKSSRLIRMLLLQSRLA